MGLIEDIVLAMSDCMVAGIIVTDHQPPGLH